MNAESDHKLLILRYFNRYTHKTYDTTYQDVLWSSSVSESSWYAPSSLFANALRNPSFGLPSLRLMSLPLFPESREIVFFKIAAYLKNHNALASPLSRSACLSTSNSIVDIFSAIEYVALITRVPH